MSVIRPQGASAPSGPRPSLPSLRARTRARSSPEASKVSHRQSFNASYIPKKLREAEVMGTCLVTSVTSNLVNGLLAHDVQDLPDFQLPQGIL